jgi:GDP-L-fucose synthase
MIPTVATRPLLFDLRKKRVFVAGHRGMVGAAIVRRLTDEGCDILVADRAELDLTRQAETERWLAQAKPHAVFIAAARVGGIYANSTLPFDFISENLAIAQNVILGSLRAGVGKLMFLGSSCIYPRLAPQPMAEESLLTGPLEPTNEWYAVAKIAGIKLAAACRIQHRADFISVMPTNLYGPGDNYHPEHSHVPAALIRRFHEAKEQNLRMVTVWGTGAPTREFLYVDDLADACVFVMKHYSELDFLNIGTGREISIGDFAKLVSEVVGFDGAIAFDTARPDGMPKKMLDVSKLTALGWHSRIRLRDGLAAAYADFLKGRVRE